MTEPTQREQLLESALGEVLGLFDFANPITIEVYDGEGVLMPMELTEEAQDIVSRAELVLDFEFDEPEEEK